jgi:spore coat-associated protein N
MSRVLTLAAIAVIVVCAAPGLAKQQEPGPYAVLTDATGNLQITNSLDGQAIFQLTGLAPGDSVSGTVHLANVGLSPGDLGLQQLDVQDQPGANGGALSDALQLEITDISGGNSIPIFAGPLGGLATQPVGAVGPTQIRKFRFRASLPEGGTPPSPTGGDNAYAGSALSMRYSWTATEGGQIDGSGGTGGGSGTTPPPITETRPTVTYRVNARRLLSRGWLDVLARCNRGCTLIVSAKAPRKTHVRIRQRVATLPLPNKTARIRLKLTRANRVKLARALRKNPKVVLSVNVKLVAAGWGETTAHGKKVSVKRSKRR